VVRALTARHLEVLRLAESGLTGRLIADRLGIAMSTVEKHLWAARALLGAATTKQAVEFARKAGAL
jgi:DNA-binding NarL/FixJ family response regulator